MYFALMGFFEVCVVEVEGKYGRIRHKLKVNLARAFFSCEMFKVKGVANP